MKDFAITLIKSLRTFEISMVLISFVISVLWFVQELPFKRRNMKDFSIRLFKFLKALKIFDCFCFFHNFYADLYWNILSRIRHMKELLISFIKFIKPSRYSMIESILSCFLNFGIINLTDPSYENVHWWS